jgi:hypothetical protein
MSAFLTCLYSSITKDYKGTTLFLTHAKLMSTSSKRGNMQSRPDHLQVFIFLGSKGKKKKKKKKKFYLFWKKVKVGKFFFA